MQIAARPASAEGVGEARRSDLDVPGRKGGGFNGWLGRCHNSRPVKSRDPRNTVAISTTSVRRR